ncbi:sigma-70 family RNA polymerase sigma factor [Paenibacillus sp. NPDC058071]|uniref:sigma-70 family RNA polymerase sigma factor n=1 Tax=Paenibacillus sp. NPDC058071 TaxID=3346326 RepID=UPI0036DEAAA0
MELDELAAAAVKGDEEALLRRIDYDKRKLYGIAFAYMRHETDALDAIQETVCRVWAKRRSLRDPKLFTTWTVRILLRVCMDERKKRRRERPSSAALFQSTPTGNVLEAAAGRLDMEAQLDRLKPHYRMVVVLKYYRDMTITDIAELMNKPDGTIRTWLHKALRILRRDLLTGKEEVGHEVRG